MHKKEEEEEGEEEKEEEDEEKEEEKEEWDFLDGICRFWLFACICGLFEVVRRRCGLEE